MKRDNVNYLVAGSVVVGTLLFLFFILYNITGQTSGDTDAYHTYYEQVGGLKYGTPVYYEGFSIGQIEEVIPEHQGTRTRFRVELTIRQGWPLATDTVAAISTSGLLSDVFIVLEQGESDQLLQVDAEITSRGVSDIFGSLGELAGNVNDLTENQIKPLIDTVSERIDNITLNLEDSTPEVIDDLKQLLGRLDDAAAGMQQILRPENVSRVDNIVADAEESMEHVRELTSRLDTIREDVNGLVNEMNMLLADNSDDVSDVLVRMKASITDFAVRLESVGSNVDEASRNFNEFTRGIRKDPSTLIFSPDADELPGESK